VSSSSGTDALAKLLSDGDRVTVQLVREQLAGQGEDAIPELQRLASSHDPCVAEHAREILQEIHRRSAKVDFDLLCRFFPEHGDLETACWELSKALLPADEIASHQKRLNSWGRQLLIRISGAVSNRERVRLLSEMMSNELGFRGNAEDYYNPGNSLLGRVMETRNGLPITLTAVAMFLASRAGMSVCGINLPGHFLARHGEVLFDPFNRGKIVTEADCRDILRSQNLCFRRDYLRPATSRQMLRRILMNLVYVYDLQEEPEQSLMIRGWMDSLCCDS
jgi:regulator of sirC expression with transglutaminase-like and TPR domain